MTGKVLKAVKVLKIVDSDDTLNMNPEDLRAKITDRTKTTFTVVFHNVFFKNSRKLSTV
ncbi:MAG TPA: hypothetical protein VKM55_24325 [Candidatus Lokiarchaeia archaeon]|nr:hypothetical protein [Candidatus Lokiarchaeia archaeon]